MTTYFRAIVMTAAASAVLLSTQAPTFTKQGRSRPVAAVPAAAEGRAFNSNQIEFYLDDEGIAYIRPGFKLKVESITIGTDRKPVVELTFTDNLDQPLDRLGKQTPGPLSISFILAAYDPNTRLYSAYTTRTVKSPPESPVPNNTAVQASTDSNGKWTDLERGRARYTFGTALPENFDKTKTTTLGVYGSRNLVEQINKTYYANVEYDFRPDGVAVAANAKWDKIRDAASCLNCHDPLALHGGSRRDVKLCVLCHNPGTTDPDTGNSVDMALMAHKIHFGPNLKNGYTIIGNRQSVHDYSHVTYPQDIRNCDNCHVGTQANNVPAQNDVWLTHPSRRACGACHDDINWVTGENHAAGAQADDSACASCHIPDSGNEFDASIKGAHTIPLKSKQLKGLKTQIVSVTNVKAGEKPVIGIKVTDNSGAAVDGSKLNTFSPIHAGPTSSYTTYFRETGAGKATFDAATGVTTYTFTNPIPAGSTGTWAFSADVYRTVNIKRTDGKADISVRESAVNPMKYVALDGGTAQARRSIVTMAQCNTCHDALALHGGQRMVIEECVICHNPTKGDASQRPADQGEEESVSFQRMIHRIHTGEEATQDITIYGNGKSRHNYNEVLYPGDRRNCVKCHVAGTQNVPPAKGADPVVTKRDFFSPQGPGTAACLGCHDNQDAAAHAFLNTTTFNGKPAEACATCHGVGKTYSVDHAHAR